MIHLLLNMQPLIDAVSELIEVIACIIGLVAILVLWEIFG